MGDALTRIMMKPTSLVYRDPHAAEGRVARESIVVTGPHEMLNFRGYKHFPNLNFF